MQRRRFVGFVLAFVLLLEPGAARAKPNVVVTTGGVLNAGAVVLTSRTMPTVSGFLGQLQPHLSIGIETRRTAWLIGDSFIGAFSTTRGGRLNYSNMLRAQAIIQATGTTRVRLEGNFGAGSLTYLSLVDNADLTPVEAQPSGDPTVLRGGIFQLLSVEQPRWSFWEAVGARFYAPLEDGRTSMNVAADLELGAAYRWPRAEFGFEAGCTVASYGQSAGFSPAGGDADGQRLNLLPRGNAYARYELTKDLSIDAQLGAQAILEDSIRTVHPIARARLNGRTTWGYLSVRGGRSVIPGLLTGVTQVVDEASVQGFARLGARSNVEIGASVGYQHLSIELVSVPLEAHVAVVDVQLLWHSRVGIDLRVRYQMREQFADVATASFGRHIALAGLGYTWPRLDRRLESRIADLDATAPPSESN